MTVNTLVLFIITYTGFLTDLPTRERRYAIHAGTFSWPQKSLNENVLWSIDVGYGRTIHLSIYAQMAKSDGCRDDFLQVLFYHLAFNYRCIVSDVNVNYYYQILQYVSIDR